MSDRATFAWVTDVFVNPQQRGLGLGRWLMETLLAHPELRGLRRWMLYAGEARELYEKLGFSGLARPEMMMERTDNGIYLKNLSPEASPGDLSGPAPPSIAEGWEGDFLFSNDPARMEPDVIHGFLVGSYWARGIPRGTVVRSLAHSLCFGVFQQDRQVGFARLVTDRATFAYLGDVFVLEHCRGRGLSKGLLEFMIAHPALREVRRWVLATADAHGLYRKFGFAPLRTPERWMEIHDGVMYTGGAKRA